MKTIKSYLISTIFIFFSFKAMATDHYEWPKVDYPTQLIGKFIGFCVNTLNKRIMMEEGIFNQMPPVGMTKSSTDVCSCIMDSYRINNSEFTFIAEYNAKDASMVPYFMKYLDQCTDINNNRFMQKEGI